MILLREIVFHLFQICHLRRVCTHTLLFQALSQWREIDPLWGDQVFFSALTCIAAITENEALLAKRLHAIQQVRTEPVLELPGICSVTA